MNASPLHDLQLNIYAAIAQDSSAGWAASEDLISATADSSLAPNFRLSIYANAYVSRLGECLAKDFSTVKKVIGDDEFHDLVIDYLSFHPPCSPNINEMGRKFASFISTHPLSFEIPFLQEVVELEWSVHAAHYAPLAAPFDFSKLAALTEKDWMRARFTLNPSLQILTSQWPVISLWLKRNDSDFSEAKNDLRSEGAQTLVYRSGAGVFLERISPLQTVTLELMRQQKTLAEISQALAAREVSESEIMAWFSNWAASQIISKVETA